MNGGKEEEEGMLLGVFCSVLCLSVSSSKRVVEVLPEPINYSNNPLKEDGIYRVGTWGADLRTLSFNLLGGLSPDVRG